MPDPTLYLFDGYNLLHAGGYDDPRELIDQLASFVARQGRAASSSSTGTGEDERDGRLECATRQDADTLLERLAAEHRDREEVSLVSSDSAVRGTSGVEVRKLVVEGLSCATSARAGRRSSRRTGVSERIDDETRAKLERLRRGQVQSKRTSE